ncbi:MAG TPA: non-homologous end-joining DNA ligase [Acidimicrobiales bacterium]|nr:non-homologous end-joining DNA ligase [Acidimicrobiales bacterium]
MSALDLRIAPMLATSGTLPKDDERWSFEVKWDGVRALTYLDGDRMRMESRNLLDITPRYPELHGLPEALGGRGAVLDGEVVSFDEAGRPSFGRLQHRMHVAGERDVRARMHEYPVVYMAFDVLWLDGESLMRRPYLERREVLASLGLNDPSWQMPGHHIGDGAAMLAASRERGLEGIIAKQVDTPYEAGKRSRCWLKVKNTARQEVVVGGWLEGSGNRTNRIGALLVGYYEGDHLHFAGKVGTGYTDRMLAELAQTLAPLGRPTSPFSDKVPYKQAHFVEPTLVCDVEFTEWTATNTLRHPSFKGLRDDKAPRDVVKEPLFGGQ